MPGSHVPIRTRAEWADEAGAVKTLDQNGSGPNLVLRHETIPEQRFEEEDQTDPAGRYRIVVTGDAFTIQRAATADWGSVTTIEALSSIGAKTITVNDAVTAAVTTALTLSHNSSGTPGTGYGVGLDFQLETSTTADTQAAAIDVLWTTATHATRTSDLVLYNVQSGTLTEMMRLDGSGNAVVLGSGDGGTTAATGNTLRAPDITTGGAGNIAGADLTIRPGLGTGTGDPGQVIFQVMPVAAAGDNIQVAATLLTLDGGGTEMAMTPVAQSGTPATTGAWFNQAAQTFTDNVTAAAGTVAAMAFNSFQIPIFDALNGAAGANRVTVTNAATVYIAGPPAPVTDKTLITNAWALEIAAGNVRIANFSIGTGTSGAYGWIGITSAGPILGEGSSASTGIYIRPLSGHYIYADAGAGLQLIGGGRLLASSATEIGLQVTNGALTVGSEGSIEAPYLSQTGALFTDAIGGNLNGCIGINYDSDTGPTSTIEVRVEGSWLSVAVAGYLIQNRVPYKPFGDTWVNPAQIKAGFLDETICIVCGEQMKPHDAISMYGNYWAGGRGLHAVFGHQHIERDSYIQKLEKRVRELEARVFVAA